MIADIRPKLPPAFAEPGKQAYQRARPFVLVPAARRRDDGFAQPRLELHQLAGAQLAGHGETRQEREAQVVFHEVL